MGVCRLLFQYNTSITIPDSVTYIGDSAFGATAWLESKRAESPFVVVNGILIDGLTCFGDVVLPDSVKIIGEGAFKYCEGLESITISDSVESIEDSAFYGCRGLTSFGVSNNNKYYSSIDGVLFNKNKTELIEYPLGKDSQEYVIPDSVTSIGKKAFSHRSSLTSITIPDSVTSIGEMAFYECSSLTSITIPDSVTYIGISAFESCNMIESVIVPASVQVIDNRGFAWCKSLKEITILNPDCEIFENKNIADDRGITISNDTNESTWAGEYNGVIYGYEGSTAQEFAEWADYRFEVLGEAPTTEVPTEPATTTEVTTEPVTSSPVIACGDVNDDGVVDLADADYIEKFLNREVNSINVEQADTNADGQINMVDAEIIRYYYSQKQAGNIISLPYIGSLTETTTGSDLKKGDANGDGDINMSDVVIVMQASLNPKKYGVNGTSEDRITAEGEKAGDVDGKTGLSANDALIIQRYSLKLIDTL